MVFVVESLSTNILPVNEATFTTFTCSASNNHKNYHELTKYCSAMNVLTPWKLPAIRYSTPILDLNTFHQYNVSTHTHTHPSPPSFNQWLGDSFRHAHLR